MILQKETIFTKDLTNKKIKVTREFDAPVEQVWKAWTDSELLDQWWAPKPWKANTVSMDFRNGGTWLYYMEGPDGTRHYCKADYKSINPNKSYEGLDAFCDEKGNINSDLPRMHWKFGFVKAGSGTKVEVEITFTTEADMEKIIEMGFKEGFAAAHSNLDELLAAQREQRK
jgi:uncharacterized protein YndB with AHSA1/START domain